LSTAVAVSVEDWLVVRLADLLLASVVEKALFDEAEAFSEAELLLDLAAEAVSEADLLCELLSEAFSEAFCEAESVVARLPLEDLLACAAILAFALLVFAAVPAVVLVAFDPEPPLVAVMLSAVVPVEEE
jgi:hypothetical protein